MLHGQSTAEQHFPQVPQWLSSSLGRETQAIYLTNRTFNTFTSCACAEAAGLIPLSHLQQVPPSKLSPTATSPLSCLHIAFLLISLHNLKGWFFFYIPFFVVICVHTHVHVGECVSVCLCVQVSRDVCSQSTACGN